MEYSLLKENCCVCETLCDSVSEQPVDIDISLPDYCPDVERILKCRLCPAVASASVTGDRLDVDGASTVSIWYLDSRKQSIRLCEHTVPFSCSFELKEAAADAVPCVRVRTDYINCRAVSPRKLDIHGAFTVSATVSAGKVQEYCTGIDSPDIRERSRSVTLSSLKGMGRQQFSLTEVLDIGKGKPSPEAILRHELTFTKGECRAIDDKLMLRGEATLRVLYVTDIESGARDAMSFSIPVNQIVDVRGIDESTQNDISVEVMNCNVGLRSEYDENSTLLTLDAKLCATVFAYSDTEINVLDDAYSVERDLELTRNGVVLPRFAGTEDMSVSVRDEIRTGENTITRVVDLWCDSISSICSFSQNTLSIKGKMELCLFALDGDGVPFCMDKAVDFSDTVDCPDDNMTYTAKTVICAPSPSFRITGDNSIEVRADVVISASVYGSGSIRSITSASADDRMRERDMQAALTLYYSEEGESLWDIARHYCTSVDAIRAENGLAGDDSDGGMLIIPM